MFASFDGANLEWDVLFPSFGGLRLTARRCDQRLGELQFLYPRYVDCPTRMTDVRIRMASPAELEEIDKIVQMSPSLREAARGALSPLAETVVAVDSREGVGFLWSAYLWIRSPGEELPPERDWKLWWPEPPPF
jgi:hypothetical protein